MSDNPRDRFAEMAGKSPEEAKFFWSGGPLAVAERTWFTSSFSGTTAFETDEGLVLVDTGLRALAPAMATALRERTSAPVHTAIYTHGHVDHAFGLDAFLLPGQPAPRVVAHRNVPARFARYVRTARHNGMVNARQFGGAADDAQSRMSRTFATAPTPPDVLYDRELDLEVGGVRFELRHCRGETDDHTWVFCPDRGVVCSGDLFIWAVPNAGNPQKVQRYPWDWATGLRAMAAVGPRTLCPGHGAPVIDDAALVRRMLVETAEYLEVLVERTLDALEAGSPPHTDVVHAVTPPVSSSPWLQPVYDEPEFIVHNVLRHYAGWFSGRPCELKPAPRLDVAREVATLAGGAAKLVARACALADAGDMRLACHLADLALEAAAADPEVRTAVAEIYEQRATGETSLMAINLFRSAAAYARDGRPFA
jgi:glyoxylase-like metal-dependent hydrolase (beta-lactamase superfamily II)